MIKQKTKYAMMASGAFVGAIVATSLFFIVIMFAAGADLSSKESVNNICQQMAGDNYKVIDGLCYSKDENGNLILVKSK